MKRVLITGYSGKIGSSIFKLITELNEFSITCLGRKNPNICDKRISWIDIKTFDESDCKEIGDFDFAFFCHGVNVGSFESQIEINAHSISKLASKISNSSVVRVLYLSSRLVYEGDFSKFIDVGHSIRPLSSYALSKFVGEEIVKSCFSNYLIFRVPSVYAEEAILCSNYIPQGNMGLIDVFLNQIVNEGCIKTFDDANFFRGYLSVNNLSKFCFKSLFFTKISGVFNSPIEENFKTFDIAEALASLFNVKRISLGPMPNEYLKYETGHMRWGYDSFQLKFGSVGELDSPLLKIIT
jgi:dTDP-4-dehydrorhamnose reductase